MNERIDQAVTGGKIISGKVAAEMLGVSYPYLYTLIEKGLLRRADKPNPVKTRQALRFFEADIKRLLEDGGVTEENPKNAATMVA